MKAVLTLNKGNNQKEKYKNVKNIEMAMVMI
jgi:hypothetical protein